MHLQITNLKFRLFILNSTSYLNIVPKQFVWSTRSHNENRNDFTENCLDVHRGLSKVTSVWRTANVCKKFTGLRTKVL